MKNLEALKSSIRASITVVSASLAFASIADPTTVPSRYDETTGKYIGDVVALTNAIKNIANNGEIVLSRGEYDVSVLADAPMYSNGTYGKALLSSDGKSGVTIRGETGNRQDVVIDGKNCGIRIFKLGGSDTVLRDMTIKGGDAGTSPGWNYRNGGGVLVGSGSIVSNCVFTACTADRGGGAVSVAYDEERKGAVLDCLLYGNSGGNGGAIRRCALVSGCTVVSNTAAGNGGGLSECMTVTNCTVAYNYAKTYGGGLYNCAEAVACTISGNVADGDPSGGYGGSYYGCTFRDNFRGSVEAARYMERCDIADGYVGCRTNVSSVIHGLHNAASDVWSVGNVQYPEGKTGVQTLGAIRDIGLMRGCLVTNCNWRYGTSGTANASLFFNVTAGARIENCTIADNAYYFLGRDLKGGQTFVNCAIVRNSYNGSAGDIPIHDSTKFCFSNCVWNVQGTSTYVTRDEAYADGENKVLGAGVDPKFVGNGEHPYTLKLKSPLREYGMVLGWMSDATDYAGNPRLRDGKVDVGAYQCWLTPTGFILSFH